MARDGTSAAELQALLEEVFDLAALLSTDGTIVYLNKAGRRLLGTDGAEPAGGDSMREVLAPADQASWDAEVMPALRSRGRWDGALSLLPSTGSAVPTRSLLRSLDVGFERVIAWVATDITVEQAVYERLHRRAFEDELTGLPHRSIFLDRLSMLLRQGAADAGSVGLLFVSLDRFKVRNDRFGRDVGDALLWSVAERLDAVRGPRDTVSRWEGDEFVVLREWVRDDAELLDLGGRIVRCFAEPFRHGETAVFLTGSVGATLESGGTQDVEQMLTRAELAARAARASGGARLQLFDHAMQARARRHADVEDALRGAAERGELEVRYQPEVSLRTNEIVAVESLVRWTHPELGPVGPGEFIPVAEASNLILEIDAWVMTEAMRQSSRWRSELGPACPTVAMNISARRFAQDDFMDLVEAILWESGAEPRGICLEITEGVLATDLDRAVSTLGELKALGVQLAIDDFGTGYSSLSYLRRFPVDVLKIDQSFVRGLGEDPGDSAIVEAVVQLSRALGLTSVAEGVETQHQLIELRDLDCDLAQGYLLAQPQSPGAVSELLRTGNERAAVSG